MLTLTALHEANIARQAAWCPDETKQPSLSFRGNELAGETGEACNVIKKLERERHGWAGSRDTLEHLAEELADVVICADLCAITAGVDLQAAVVAKFNATSEKVGLPHRLEEQSPSHREADRLEANNRYLQRARDAEQKLSDLQALIAALRDQSWDLRCFDIPTGGDDCDIGWRVVGHWMAEPRERVIAEVFNDDPAEAIRQALAAQKSTADQREAT